MEFCAAPGCHSDAGYAVCFKHYDLLCGETTAEVLTLSDAEAHSYWNEYSEIVCALDIEASPEPWNHYGSMRTQNELLELRAMRARIEAALAPSG